MKWMQLNWRQMKYLKKIVYANDVNASDDPRNAPNWICYWFLLCILSGIQYKDWPIPIAFRIVEISLCSGIKFDIEIRVNWFKALGSLRQNGNSMHISTIECIYCLQFNSTMTSHCWNLMPFLIISPTNALPDLPHVHNVRI